MADGKTNPIYGRRRARNMVAVGASILVTVFGLAVLALILTSILRHGIAAISLTLFTESTPPPGAHGGLLNAIVGSLLLNSVAVVFGTPLGILAGTYLAEFGRGSRFSDMVRFINDMLLSAPSILLGLFAYETVVVTLGHFSGWAGSFALSLIVIPVVVRTTEDMLLLVPMELREAGIGLGAPYWRVVTMVCYRAARAGMLTGILLAVARISGETAPLLFTALNNQFFSLDLDRPMSNLPTVIFQFAMSPYDEWRDLAWAGALLITAAVLGLNIMTRAILPQSKGNT
jgi:phosphate transport system permease protein